MIARIMTSLRIFRDLASARAAILTRRPLDEAAATPEMAARLRQIFGEELTPAQAVERILAQVRAGGDAALRDLGQRIDGYVPDAFLVGPEEYAAARQAVSPALKASLERAAERIAAFHRRQLRQSWLHYEGESVLGQIVRPLDRVGIYAPGGRAVYPSTLLMQAVPAQVAGVPEISVATPPRPDGGAAPAVLVAAEIAGVSRVYKVGGAQAIAALAYGTETIPRVDKVVGPGNIFVALAKRRLFGEVGIDQVAGPTETVVIADDGAHAATVAADLLAQAEHDPLAAPVLLTTSLRLAIAVAAEVERQLEGLPKADVARQALGNRGGAVVVESVAEALALANEYAPEHLCLLVAEPWRYLPLVRNAGGIFLGERSPETMGDYIAGPSHVMPTGGTARFSSAQSTDDFLKTTNLVALGEAEFIALAPDAIALAEAEGLQAHADAIRARLTQGGQLGEH
ncbi:MAG: histidinol dehydrogenase [Chloroflexota bacterium]